MSSTLSFVCGCCVILILFPAFLSVCDSGFRPHPVGPRGFVRYLKKAEKRM